MSGGGYSIVFFLLLTVSMSHADTGTVGSNTCSCEAAEAFTAMETVWFHQPLVADELEGAACFELSLLRNAVFGSYGWDPGHDTLKRHWLTQSFQGYNAGCYCPTFDDAGEIELIDTDRDNIRLIQAAERDGACDDWWDSEEAETFLLESRVFVDVYTTTWTVPEASSTPMPTRHFLGVASPDGVSRLVADGGDWKKSWALDGYWTCDEVEAIQDAVWSRYAFLGDSPMIDGELMTVDDMQIRDQVNWHKANTAANWMGCNAF
jgi:hypothetical protein